MSSDGVQRDVASGGASVEGGPVVGEHAPAGRGGRRERAAVDLAGEEFEQFGTPAIVPGRGVGDRSGVGFEPERVGERVGGDAGFVVVGVGGAGGSGGGEGGDGDGDGERQGEGEGGGGAEGNGGGGGDHAATSGAVRDGHRRQCRGTGERVTGADAGLIPTSGCPRIGG